MMMMIIVYHMLIRKKGKLIYTLVVVNFQLCFNELKINFFVL